MNYTEKTVQCVDCGKAFPFTAGEQEFFASKGFTNEPKRCQSCRQTKRIEYNGNAGGNGRSPRQMYPVTCARCGMETEVPFQPRGDRPVYCRGCFHQNA